MLLRQSSFHNKLARTLKAKYLDEWNTKKQVCASGKLDLYTGHYQKMEQSLSLMVFSQARCPRFAFSMYNISFRGALLEPHAISRFRVRYLQKRDARSAILSIFTVSLGQGK